MNIVIASAAIVTSVDAAFRLSGGWNAGHAVRHRLDPVIAVQPFENAVSSANVVSIRRSEPLRLAASAGHDAR
jgi:hypothetical protein